MRAKGEQPKRVSATSPRAACAAISVSRVLSLSGACFNSVLPGSHQVRAVTVAIQLID